MEIDGAQHSDHAACQQKFVQQRGVFADLAFHHGAELNDREAAKDRDDHILRRVYAQIIAGKGR